MSFQLLKNVWKKSFEESISSIENAITVRPDDYQDLIDFRTLSKWLLDTSLNPYSFMPHGYQSYRYQPYTTDSLLSLLHHALLDDGEVSFVKMIHKGETLRVFMMFVWHNEDCFNSLCLVENKSLVDTVIHGAEMSNRIYASMKEKYPENQKFQQKQLPELTDFEFVAHRNPVQFIAEVEDFEKKRMERITRSEEMRTQLIK